MKRICLYTKIEQTPFGNMVKPKQKNSLGRSLIKAHSRSSKNRKTVGGESLLHTTEVKDGYDWGRLNLQSVTEESSFQEFLATAQLAGTEFHAEKLNIKFVNPKAKVGLLTDEETRRVKAKYEKHKDIVRIPRRPSWDRTMTAEKLDELERHEFLKWRRSLAELQENEGCLLTPFEKNLEFWRQLWRVVERSDVVIQIVDARNPLLFRCEDLEKYVKEVDGEKDNLILINKSEFLTDRQRQIWAEHFDKKNVRVVFFSAITEVNEDEIDKEPQGKLTVTAISEVANGESNDEEEQSLAQVEASVSNVQIATEKIKTELRELQEFIETKIKEDASMNSHAILSRTELIDYFKTCFKGKRFNSNYTTIGLIGYPNVGKSSTINSLLKAKKVSVSATPGKTKHFQTIYLDKDLLLCDCPGLVMPSLVYTKAEMILNGILPIDQMRDHVPPVNLVCHLLPRHIFEDKYGIMLPPPMRSEEPNRKPTSEELLNAHAFNRGFMTANGQPDNSRSARYILKDFVNGRLLYAHAPPDFQQENYHTWPERQRAVRPMTAIEFRAIKSDKITSEEKTLKEVLKFTSSNKHIKGAIIVSSGESQDKQAVEIIDPKPWRTALRNKPKKDKVRRMYAHLDQH